MMLLEEFLNVSGGEKKENKRSSSRPKKWLPFFKASNP